MGSIEVGAEVASEPMSAWNPLFTFQIQRRGNKRRETSKKEIGISRL
jgi:hypothetical protein